MFESTMKALVELGRMEEGLGWYRAGKLLYVTQGLHQSAFGKPAFTTPIEAWPSGPMPSGLAEEFDRVVSTKSSAKPTPELAATVARVEREFPASDPKKLDAFCSTSKPFMDARKGLESWQNGPDVDPEKMAAWMSDARPDMVEETVMAAYGEKDEDAAEAAEGQIAEAVIEALAVDASAAAERMVAEAVAKIASAVGAAAWKEREDAVADDAPEAEEEPKAKAEKRPVGKKAAAKAKRQKKMVEKQRQKAARERKAAEAAQARADEVAEAPEPEKEAPAVHVAKTGPSRPGAGAPCKMDGVGFAIALARASMIAEARERVGLIAEEPADCCPDALSFTLP